MTSKPSPPTPGTPSREVDALLADLDDWRGETLSLYRSVIRGTVPEVVEEVRWKRPSNPAGVPVWSHHGILCTGAALKHAARLTFPKGAKLEDPHGLFNAALGGNWMRAIDLHEGEGIDEAALQALLLEAVRFNASRR